jgi:protocatechuate 3,4-dioxygenase beta subunit
MKQRTSHSHCQAESDCVPQAAYSQVLYGSLTGTVTDPKGAVVPGVKVEALNIATGRTRETTTDASGSYQFTDLTAGTFSVTFGLASFKTIIQENVKVNPNTSTRVDTQMQVADDQLRDAICQCVKTERRAAEDASDQEIVNVV